MKKQIALIFLIVFFSQFLFGQKYHEIVEKENKNIVAIGYQIGGYTLIGIDYEVRLHDYFGIHFGGGFSGYTAGLKIHTNPLKNSSFINLSFKDGGFGLISAAGIEYGIRWVFNKETDFGLHFQFGMMKILSITKEFEDLLYKDKDAPPFTMSFGIGFSW